MTRPGTVKTARDLGLSRESLRQALLRRGLKPAIPRAPGGHPPYKLSKEHAIGAAQAIAKGQSLARTAAGLGVNPQTLRDALKRHGLRPRANQNRKVPPT